MNGYAPLPPGFEMMEPPEGFELDEEQGAPPPPEGFEMAPLPAGFEMEQPRAALPAGPDMAKYGFGPESQEEDEIGYWSNKARGFGEQAVDIGADLVNMVGRVGESIGEGAAELVIGDAEETKRLKKIIDQKKKDGTYDAPFNVAKIAADAWKERDFGYEQTASLQDIKDAEGFMDTVTTGLEFALDTGVTSLPHMAGMMINMPAYLVSRTEALASDRAEAQGRKEPIAEDFGWGGVTALAVTALDKIGLDKLLSFAKAGGGSVMKGMAKGAAEGTLTEGMTETAQEFIEYMGTHAGTEEGANMADAMDAALAGLIGGGPFGGVAGGVSGGVGVMRDNADARTAIPTTDETAGDDTAEFTDADEVVTPATQAGEAEVAAARAAINPDPVVPGTAEADAEIARQMGEPPPTPAAVDQAIPTDQPQPGGAPLEPMAPEDVDQIAAEDTARLAGLLNEKYAAEAANEAEVEAPPALAAGAMQFQTPPQTPMMARSMEALSPGLEKFNGQRELLTGGRARKATPEMLADADVFWAQALQQANLLDSEGYDTAALRQVLRKAAGNKPATEKTLSDRENRPVTARFRGDIDIETGQPKTHRTPKGGWGSRLEGMYAGVFGELNKLTQQGPTKTPKTAKPAPVKTTTGSATAPAAEPVAPVVEEAVTDQVPVEQPAAAPAEKVESVRAQELETGVDIGGESATADTMLSPEDQMLAEEAGEAEVDVAQLTNNERIRRRLEEIKQKQADAEKAAKVEEARAAGEAQVEAAKKKSAPVQVSTKGTRLKRPRPKKTVNETIKAQPAGQKGKMGLSKKPVKAEKTEEQILEESAERLKKRGILPPDYKQPSKKPAPKAPEKKTEAEKPAPLPLPKQVGPQKKDKFASAPARERAAELGLTESEIVGTGAKGKITKRDVDRARENKQREAEREEFKKEATGTSERQMAAKEQRTLKDQLEDAETTALSLEDNPAREDILAGRTLAADAMDSALEGGPTTGIDLLNFVQKHLDPADPYNVLINKLRSVGVGGFDIEMVDIGDMIDEAGNVANGLYKSFKNERGMPQQEILINEHVSGTLHGLKVLLHEMVHGATAEGMTTDNELAQKMESIRKRVMKHLEALGDQEALKAYGFTDVDEFVAEALSSESFQRILAGVPSGNNSNSWRDMLAAISNFLGFQVDQSTALNEVLALAPDLFISDAQSMESMLSGRRKFVSNQKEEIDMDSLTQEERDAMMGLSDRTAPDPARGATVNTARRLGDNTVADVTGKMYDAVKGTTSRKELARGTHRVALGFHTLDQIVRRYQPLFQEAGKNALSKYDGIMRRKNQYAREAQQRAELLNERWQKFERKGKEYGEILGKFMHDATMSGIHPDKAWNSPANAHLHGKQGAKEQWRLMNKRFNKLPAGGRGIYRDASNFYRDQRNDMRKASLKHMARTWGLDKAMSPTDFQKVMNAKTSAEIRAINFGMLGKDEQRVEDALAQIADLTSIQGPYFPLRRYGKYVVEAVREGEKIGKTHAKRKDAWEAARKARSTSPEAKIRTRRAADGTYYNEKVSRTVEMFDDIAEAETRSAELQGSGYTGRQGGAISPSMKSDWTMPPGTAANTLLAQAKRKFDADSPQAKAMDTAFIELLLENNMRKSELQRKKVAGASTDMRRAFAERAHAGSWGIADIETALDHGQAIRDMDTQARGNVKAGEVVKEIRLRDEKALADRKIGGLDAALSKFGFINFLFSPSYTLVNLTQVPLVAAPYLTAKYGPRAMTSLARSYRGVATAGGKALMDVKFGTTGESPVGALQQVLAQLDGYSGDGNHTGEAAAVQTLVDQGIIDATFMQELYRATKGKKEGPIGKSTDYLLNVARTTPQVAEVLNRVVVARSAYELEMNKSGSEAKATEAASEAVLQTQFDYTNENKPRYFKAFPGARAIMMFKMYAQGMYALIASSAVNSVKGNTPESRTEARKMLAGLVASHSLTAGVLGGVAMEPVRALISSVHMIAQVLGWDEDDTWDLDQWVTQALYDLTGSAALTEVITRGVPRAAGLDLSGRVGLDNMAFMGMRDARSYQEGYKNFIVAAGGPVVAAGGNVMRGVDYLGRGEVRRGIEAASPKLVRDALKTWRIADEGMLDYNGNMIAGKQDFSTRDYISQALGIQPASSARMYEGRTAAKNVETKLRDRRKKLMMQWRRKDPKERAEFYRSTIAPFGRRNPDFKVGIDQLLKSLTEQRRREGGTRGGVFTENQSISRITEAYGG